MPPAAIPARSFFRFRFPGLRTVTLFLTGLLLLLLFNVGSLRRYVAARQQRNKLRDVVEAKKEEVRELDRQKRSLELGMFENEKSVRESYNLLRPGERMILLRPEESGTSAPAGRESARETPAKSR